MRIAALPPQLTQSLLAALPVKQAAAFVRDHDAEANAAPVFPARASLAPASVQLLVAIAATEPATERRRKLAAEADKGLRSLERLHAELLAGAASAERMQAIQQWAASAQPPDTPALRELFRDIELRVKVELAKYDLRA